MINPKIKPLMSKMINRRSAQNKCQRFRSVENDSCNGRSHSIARRALPLLWIISFASFLHADEKPESITIATWNVEWFFDAHQGDNSSDLAKQQSAPERDEWEWKLSAVAGAIAEMQPSILALQEVENRQVVYQLTKRLAEKHGLNYRIAFIEGWDIYTEQDVAVIYRSGLVQFSFREQTSEMFNSREYYNLNKHIFCEFQWSEGDDLESLTLLNVHLRATPEKHDLRRKQCRLIRAWLKNALDNGEHVIVIGDLNTEELAGSIQPGSDLAILCGWETNDESDDLVDLNQFLADHDRSTHQIGKQFDRILVSQSMMNDIKRPRNPVFFKIENLRDAVVVGSQDKNHFNEFYNIPQAERDFSDHYPIIAKFLFQ